MTNVIINGTKEHETLEIIDPKTSLDWSGDLLSNYDAGTWLDSGCVCMSRADFEWWENLMKNYEEADTEAYDFFDELEVNIEDIEEAGNKITEIREYFEEQKMLRKGGELEDEPKVILEALQDTKDVFSDVIK